MPHRLSAPWFACRPVGRCPVLPGRCPVLPGCCPALPASTCLSASTDRLSLCHHQSPIVVWKMKAPEKKPLVRREKPEEVRAKVRKGSQKKHLTPIKALAEFQSPADSV